MKIAKPQKKIGSYATPVRISKFLGLNLSNTGDTQIQLGESGNMTNFYITDDYKLRKMHGYKNFWDFNSPIRGMYSTNLGGTEYLFVAAGGYLYSFLKSKLEDDWELIGDDSQVEGQSMSTEYQLISTMGPLIREGEIRTYGKYSTQDEETNTTIYQIKATYYNQQPTIQTYSSGTYTFEGISESITPDTHFPVGETTIFEESFQVQHNEQGISPSVSASSSFQAVINDTTVEYSTGPIHIKFPKIGTPPFYGVEPTLLGYIGDRETSFFTFDNKVYVLSGQYHSVGLAYNSQSGEYEPTLNEVQGYIPLVFVNTPPAGGGTLYDEINMLTSKKHQTFNGDGSSTVYYLAENFAVSGYSPIVDKVLVNGVLVPSSSYTTSPVQGTVTFNTAPSTGTDNVDIYWGFYTVDEQGGLFPNNPDRHLIDGMRYGTVFGGDVDTRVFLYGNSECTNRTYFSGIADDGTNVAPSPEYFPATAQVDVGPSNFILTDLTRQYDRLLATTNRPEAYYLTISLEQLPVTLGDGSSATRYVPSVSTFPLNEAYGNMALGQGQLIDNYPVTIDRTGLALWKATNVRDEKNMEIISQRIDLDFMDLTMSAIKTMDFQSKRQLWFGYDNIIYIYNYYNKTFSRLLIADSLTCYEELGNNAYMGLYDGRVVKWGEEFPNFDGETIFSHWEMNFEDFETAHLRKTMKKLWVLMQPQGYSSAEIGYITNAKESPSKKKIEYHIILFDSVDFNNFSFKVSTNPQPYRLKLKAKKFTNLKITIDNTEDSDCTVLQLVLNIESFGESK